jgi:putative transposase
MPRSARIIIPGIAHHIIQRGNNRQNILEEDVDFRNYCYWINEYSPQYKVSILAYCLMNNHVHFIVVPQDAEGIPRLFRTVHMRYAQYANYTKRRSGHLWQGRYFSCVLDDEHLFYAIRYVEQNPVRANMVKYPWDYEWSSAKWHVDKTAKKYIKITDTTAVDRTHWKMYLLNNDKGIDEEITKKIYKGKAFAGEDFIIYWEQRLNCVLRELKPGRKRKRQK